MPVSRWMRRSDHPNRPKALTCCFFDSFKTLLTSTEGTPSRQSQRPECWFIVGRFSGDYLWPVLGDHRGSTGSEAYRGKGRSPCPRSSTSILAEKLPERVAYQNIII